MNWITTKELGKFLVAHPGIEYECRMRVGGGIASTHWWYFDPEHQCLQHSRDIDYSRVDAQEFLQYYGDCMWKIEQ